MTVSAEIWLAAVSLVHVGFQAAVSVVVYPALATSSEDAWAQVHAEHSRRISFLVGPLYLGLLAVNLLVLIRGPWTTGTLLALAGNGVAGLTTALVAGPTHSRLSRGRTPVLTRRLLRADRVRLAGAAVAGMGAMLILG